MSVVKEWARQVHERRAFVAECEAELTAAGAEIWYVPQGDSFWAGGRWTVTVPGTDYAIAASDRDSAVLQAHRDAFGT